MSDVSLKFETTRRENDELLSDKLEQLRSGEDIKTLEPFARAYLGMFYEIDKELSGEDKVALLANAEVRTAVLQGFVAALQRDDIPVPEQIGIHFIKGELAPLGYVLLAGIDRVMLTGAVTIDDCKPALLQSLLCFHYSHNTGYRDLWFNEVLNNTAIAIPALSSFWSALLKHKSQILPGLYDIIEYEERRGVSAGLLIPVMRQWTYCNKKIFRTLLYAAIRSASHDALLALAKEQLGDDEINDVKKLYWHAAVFMLGEDDHGQALASFCERVKLKILPLLDFAMEILKTELGHSVSVRAMQLAWLLRIIAPIFPPQQHAYGSYGRLDVNSQNVMYLFHQLVLRQGDDVDEAIKWLKKARVMKVYTDVISQVIALRKKKKSSAEFELPDYEAFVTTLKSEDKLMGRSNRFKSGAT